MGGERASDGGHALAPVLRDPDLTLYQGDVRDVLRELPDDSVDCVVTSPPYWGLRDYGVGPSVWGGEDEIECEHEWGEQQRGKRKDLLPAGESESAGRLGTYDDQRGAQAGGKFCERCGAWLGCLGLEPTPDLFVEHVVEIFREVGRVLASHGTCWLNIGDSYATKPRGSDAGWAQSRLRNPGRVQKAQRASLMGAGADRHRGASAGLKNKDLVGMPWMVAFALRADGWWLRSDNIWGKPNPMPESVDDRPTRAHEFVFLLAKSGDPHYWTHRDGRLEASRPTPDYRWVHLDTREEAATAPPKAEARAWRRINLWGGHDYYYDQEAAREPFAETTHASGNGFKRDARLSMTSADGSVRGSERPWVPPSEHSAQETLGDLPPEAPRGPDGRRETHIVAGEGSLQHRDGERWPASGRNMRSVWSIPTQGYPGAHFATFPEELARRCIEAGCPLEVCRGCGKPRTRMVDVGYENPGNRSNNGRRETGTLRDQGVRVMSGGRRLDKTTETTGWSDCRCADYRAGVVMDPFGGSGTVGVVARTHGRHALLVELSADYCDLIIERTSQLSLLAEEAPS